MVATSATASTAPVTVAVRESFVNDFMACSLVEFKAARFDECGQHGFRRASRPAIQPRHKFAEKQRAFHDGGVALDERTTPRPTKPNQIQP
jgi:hypothetical protein